MRRPRARRSAGAATRGRVGAPRVAQLRPRPTPSRPPRRRRGGRATATSSSTCGRLLRPAAAGQRRFGIGKGREQRRPDGPRRRLRAKRGSGCCRRRRAQPMTAYARCRAGSLEPGRGPATPSRSNARGHRGQARHAGAAQGLQQEGLGLVAAVMGEQHEAGAAFRASRRAPRSAQPRPGLDALARRGRVRPGGRRTRREAAAAHAGRSLAVFEPGIGCRSSPWWTWIATTRARRRGATAWRAATRGVAAAAEGDADGAR